MIKLIIKAAGHDEEKEYNFDQNIIKFGRLKANDVILPGENISRHHCTITREEGQFHITDNSSNGAFLNKKIIGRGNQLPLRNGDIIDVGDFSVEFQLFVPTEELEKTTDYLQKKFEELMAESTPEPEYPSLLIVGGPTGNTRIELIDQMEEILLGRTPDCPVQIPSPTISKHHARIIRRGGIIEIEDLGSANGTYVNGIEIKGVCRLNDRAEIVLGQKGEEEPICIVFSLPDAISAAPSAGIEEGEAPATIPMSSEEVSAKLEQMKQEKEAASDAAPDSEQAPPTLPSETTPELEPTPPPTGTGEEAGAAPTADAPPPSPVEPPTMPLYREEVKSGMGIIEYLIFGAVGLALIIVIVILLIFVF